MAPPTPTHAEIIDRCHRAIRALGYRYPHLLLIHARIRSRYRITDQVQTMAIDQAGNLYLNPRWTSALQGAELGGVLAHEILHPTLDHFARAVALGLQAPEGKPMPGREADLRLWNVACDCAINASLIADGITLPRGACLPPSDYSGPLQAEPIWDHLRKRGDSGEGEGSEGSGEGAQGNGAPLPGKPTGPATRGCGVLPAPGATPQGATPQGSGEGEGEPIDWRRVKADALATAQAIGVGSSALARLLSPYDARIRWERLIRRGFALAQSRRGQGGPTYSKIGRRNPPGVIRPGHWATTPRIAIAFDVSGSMSREWFDRIIAETLACLRAFPDSRAYLVAHTDRVEFADWIRPGGDRARVNAATQWTGGTDARPAYDAIRKAGRFDALIHFTDCELPGWPEIPPGARLVVGAFGSGASDPYCKPPPGAEVIACAEG